MQQRQIDNLDRQRREHAHLVGAMKLEHEKQIYLQNAASLKCPKLDTLLASGGVSKMTGLDLVNPDNNSDAWDP